MKGELIMTKKILISCAFLVLMFGMVVRAEVIAPTTVEHADGTYTTSGKNTDYKNKLVFIIALKNNTLSVDNVMHIDQGFVNADGTYSFQNYKPRVDITNTSTKYDVYVSFSGVTSRVAAGQMKMYVPPLKKLSGTVTNEGRNTAKIELSQGGVVKYTTTVNSGTGAYSIDAIPGTYKVVVKKDAFLSETINSLALTTDKTENFALTGGDANNDGYINMLDLTAFMLAFGKSTGASGYSMACDIDYNGIVNSVDIGYVISAFGRTNVVR